jgi:aspartyl-tRNA(Asn)/glutamyl-tRNA(Gln) amidotransferase subunit A
MLGTFALSAGYYDRFYGRAQRARTLLRRDFTNVFDSGIDVLLAPVTPTAAFPCEAPPWAIERGAGAQDH